MQEQNKLSTRKLIFFMRQKLDHDKDRVEKIAKAKGITMAQLSLAWIMSQKGVFRSIVILFRCFWLNNEKFKA